MSGPGSPFASSSLPRHLLRGAVGFGLVGASFALLPLVGPVSLALVPLGLVALRGCPMCWTLGLVETLSRRRVARECVDGTCRLVPGDGTGSPRGHGSVRGTGSLAEAGPP